MGRKLWIGLAVGALLLGAVPGWAATINVGPAGDYATIQAAIDAAVSGDTIQVAAGTYYEQVIIDKAVSVLGAGAATTFIDGTGVTPVPPGLVNITNETGAVTLDGFTIRNAPAPGGTRITIWARQADEGPVYSSSMTITHNILVGSGHLVSYEDYGLYSKYNKSNLVFSYNDVSNFGGNAFVFELHTGPAEISHNTITVDPGCGSTAFFSMSYLDGYSNHNDVTGKQWLHDNTINANGESAITIASAAGFSAYNDNKYGAYTNVEITDNVITNVGDAKKGIQLEVDGDNGGFVNSPIIAHNTISAQNPGSGTSRGIRIMGVMSGAHILDNVITGFYRGIYQSDSFSHLVYPMNTQIRTNVITGGTYGIDIAGGTATIHLNSIVGNTLFGVNNQTVATVDAINNWWGDNSGPSGGALDPETSTPASGTGDVVSANVHFDPWIEVAINGTETKIIPASTTETIENGELGIGADVTTNGNGSSTVILVEYSANPSGVAFEGSFYDLSISDPDNVDQIILKLYYNEPASKLVYWFNGSAWVLCSDQAVVAGAVTVEGVTYDGRVEVTVNDTTTPSLADLQGTFFAMAAPEPESPTGDSGSLPVGPLAVGVSAFLAWWKRRKQRQV